MDAEPKPAGSFPTLLRGAMIGDVAILRDSWLRSFRQSYHVRGVESPIYFKEHRRIVDILLGRGTTLVMCDKAQPDFVFGWVNFEVEDNWIILHFLYVKGPYQDYKLGTQMMQAIIESEPNARGILYTHQTKAGKSWAAKMTERAPEDLPVVYDPYFLYKTTMGADR